MCVCVCMCVRELVKLTYLGGGVLYSTWFYTVHGSIQYMALYIRDVWGCVGAYAVVLLLGKTVMLEREMHDCVQVRTVCVCGLIWCDSL